MLMSSCLVWAYSNLIICLASFIVFIVDNVWNMFFSASIGG